MLHAVLGKITEDGHWRFGIGDPTLMGWTITVAYLVTAGLCWNAARVAHRDAFAPAARTHRFFWLLLALAIMFLGINKQLDLQTWLTEQGRSLAEWQGWYQQRRIIQLLFIGVLAFGGVMTFALIMWWVRNLARQLWPALLGISMLEIFVLARACSFNHVDQWFGLRFNFYAWRHAFELSGILLIAVGAAWRSFGDRRPGRPP
jgi:hypothetical protein